MLQTKLDKIVSKHLKWLKNEGGVRADLRGANLSEANLCGANLRESNLREANLRRADLRGVDLRESNLREANLSGADLRESDLRESNLCEADLGGADLRWANLCESNLGGAALRWADLRGANFRGVKNLLLGPQRSDGYFFYAHKSGDNGWRISAGCRDFSFAEWRRHTQSYDDPNKKRETEWIIDSLEARINQMENQND